MMGAKLNTKRENCGHCLKQIYLGQSAIICACCDMIFHNNCARELTIFRNRIFCPNCIEKFDIVRYNPYFNYHEGNIDNDKFYEEEPINYIDIIEDMSTILENCKGYSTVNLNKIFHEHLEQVGSDTASFSTYFYNIDGNKTNFDEFAVNVKSITNEFCVIGLAETNIDPCNKDLYMLDGYSSCYESKKEGKDKGSGVALYIHNKFNYTELSNASSFSDNLESIFIEITNTPTPVIVGAVYRPPNGDSSMFLTELMNIMADLPSNNNTFILGDFNMDLLDTKNLKVQNFEDIVITSGFTPLISIHTHHRPGSKKTCIDNILTNAPENALVSGTIDNGSRHHKPVFQFSYINTGISDIKDKVASKMYYDYSNKNIENFCSYLRTNLSDSSSHNSFSNFIEFYESAIDNTCKLESPKVSKRTSAINPWITPGLINSITEKDKLHKNWAKSKNSKQPDGNPALYDKYKQHRKILKYTIKKAKSKYYFDKFDKHKGDPKSTWKIINELRGKSKHGLKSSFVVNDERITCRRAIANKFNEYFNNMASKLNSTALLNDNFFGLPIVGIPNFHTFLNQPENSSVYLADTHNDEIEKIVREFENGKASDVPIILVKRSIRIISPILTELYNTCIAEGVFPIEFKSGKITPVYKKGNAELLENYRPVSTLPIFGKIFEKIIYSRLYSFLTAKGILHEKQFGFRKGHSTSHALHSSVGIIKSATNEGKHVLGIFIDLSKAFDTLDHRILLQKLEHYGIRGNAQQLLNSYLTGRNHYTAVHGEHSEKLSVIFGVPQGSVLGPLLFLLYINDLKNSYNGLGCNFILYADDTNIFVMGSTKEEAYINANNILNDVHSYMKCNFLHINMSKSCYMHFEPSFERNDKCSRTTPFVSNRHTSKAIYINGIPIKKVSETKFLGVIIDDKLSWHAHIEYLAKKLRSTAAVLCRIRHYIPKENFKNLYYALFESHLSYGITVWGGISKTNIQKIFSIQKHCIRILFGDLDAYLDKFCTCARVRPYGFQKLGEAFYCLEHTKILFNDNDLLAVENLFAYHCCIETFKILKFRTPITLHSLLNVSCRNNSMLIIPPTPSIQFAYTGPKLWNNIRKKLLIDPELDSSTKLSIVKSTVKNLLLTNQKKYDKYQWCPYNFTRSEN